MKYLKYFESNNIEENILIIKNYVSILGKSDYNFCRKFFIALHNFLIIESIYPDCKFKLNKYLDLTSLNDVEEINHVFQYLYTSDSELKYSMEIFDRINLFMKDIIKKYDIYNKLLTEIDIEDIKMSKNMSLYNI